MDLSIGDVAQLTGVAEGTLRMWESRHGFPVPHRLRSGHRRYTERDVELVRRVAADRAAGMSLAMAVQRAQRDAEVPARSLYAALRRRRPELEPCTLRKGVLLALSHALEVESLWRADAPLLFASFQRERFFRHEEARWRELAREAELAIVFADFPRVRSPRGGPVELPIARDEPLMREWAIVCDAPRHGVCLAGWEPPSRSQDGGGERVFEVVWSVEPEIVRDAARICADIAAAVRPGLVDPVLARLATPPSQRAGEQLTLATAIANRALSLV